MDNNALASLCLQGPLYSSQRAIAACDSLAPKVIEFRQAVIDANTSIHHKAAYSRLDSASLDMLRVWSMTSLFLTSLNEVLSVLDEIFRQNNPVEAAVPDDKTGLKALLEAFNQRVLKPVSDKFSDLANTLSVQQFRWIYHDLEKPVSDENIISLNDWISEPHSLANHALYMAKHHNQIEPAQEKALRENLDGIFEFDALRIQVSELIKDCPKLIESCIAKIFSCPIDKVLLETLSAKMTELVKFADQIRFLTLRYADDFGLKQLSSLKHIVGEDASGEKKLLNSNAGHREMIEKSFLELEEPSLQATNYHVREVIKLLNQ